jgi:hypothetical protein
MSRPQRWAVLILVALAAACDAGGGTGPGVDTQVRMQISRGDAQQGLPGETLPVPLAVTLTRADGTPVAGRAVRFTALGGTLEVVAGTTTAQGEAYAWWTLPAGAGELAVRVEAEGVQPVRFTAGPLPADQTDVVWTRHDGPVTVFAYDAFAESGVMRGFRARFADSLLLRPFNPPTEYNEVFAFSPGHVPVVSRVAWTHVRDSVPVYFPEPVTVPLTIWVVKAPFAPLAERSRALVDSATSAWRRGGIEFQARIVDATGFTGAAAFQSDVNPCTAGLPERIGADAGRINVYYVGGVYIEEFDTRAQGVYCGQEVIGLAADNTRSPWLLGHEIGHAFGLGHEPEGNLMDGMGRGRHVTAGQIFRAHFDRNSSLSRLLVLYGRDQVRECGAVWDKYRPSAQCPPPTLDVD